MSGINVNLRGLTTTDTDARYYQQSQFVTAAATNSPVKTLSTTGLLDPTFTSQDVTKEPTGFVDRTSSVLSFVSGTRTFTITGTNFVVYSNGNKITKNTESIVIPNTTGLYWIYYAPTTYVLTVNTTPPGFNSGAILISNVYWNATKGEAIPPADERHGISMDWNTHEMMHKTIGTRYESGLTGTFTNTTMEVTSGKIWDEDIEITIPLTTACIVLFRSGSDWIWTGSNNTVQYETGGSVQYDNAGVLTPAGANDYVAYWVFATNNITYPIISIMGQRTDRTIANARANNTYQSLSFGTLPFVEYKLLYRVIVRNDATPYEETQDLRSVSNVPSGTYVATAHGTLTGLLNDDHTQYQLRSEFIDSTTGVADAAKPVETNVSGLIGDTFLGNAVLKSSLIASTAGATDAGKPIKTDGAGFIDTSFLEQQIFNNGYMCLYPNYPDIEISSGETTIYFVPDNGSLTTLYVGDKLLTKNFYGGITTIAVPDVLGNYDVFGFWNTATPRFETELVAWTNDSLRASSIGFLADGMIVKVTDKTRKYLGTIRVDASLDVFDNTSKRFIFNQYNKRRKRLKTTNSGATWTYSTNAYREWNNGTNQTRGEFVLGTDQTVIGGLVGISIAITTDYDRYKIAASIDQTSVFADGVYSYTNFYYKLPGSTYSYLRQTGGLLKAIEPGYHFLTGVEIMPDGTSATVENNGYGYIDIMC